MMIQVIHFCIKAINFQLHPPTAYSNFISGVLQRPMDPLTAYLSHRKDELKPATILTRLDDFSTFSTWFCLHHLVQPSLLLPIKDSLYTLRRTYRRKNKALRSQRTMASEVVPLQCIYSFNISPLVLRFLYRSYFAIFLKVRTS